MNAETHDGYDVFWERRGRTVHFAMIGHSVGLPSEGLRIALPYASE